ncbi:Serine active site containing protein 1 [Xylographa pallens]|nr:Serine active site containing protein 1 [Xylographa pallens]
MAEALGLAASILQIVSTGVKVSLYLYRFAETVSSAGKALKEISDDIAFTTSVLEQLRTTLESEKHHGTASTEALSTADLLVRECSNVFEAIMALVKKHFPEPQEGQRSIARLNSLKWPFIQPKIESLRSKLEKHKTKLILMTQVLTFAKIAASEQRNIDKQIEQERQKLEALLIVSHRAKAKSVFMVNPIGLTEVFSPSEQASVDVVFIHGIFGHPKDTWTCDDADVFWPAELLPPILEDESTRILTYGYDAGADTFTDGQARHKIHDVAGSLGRDLVSNRQIRKAIERPLVFIAHSLGGLVVKGTDIVEILDDLSARLSMLHEEATGIQSDHHRMSKFSSENSPGFDHVCTAIQNYVYSAPVYISSRWEEERTKRKLQSNILTTNVLSSAMRCSTNAYLPDVGLSHKPISYPTNQPLDYHLSISLSGAEENENHYHNSRILQANFAHDWTTIAPNPLSGSIPTSPDQFGIGQIDPLRDVETSDIDANVNKIRDTSERYPPSLIPRPTVRKSHKKKVLRNDVDESNQYSNSRTRSVHVIDPAIDKAWGSRPQEILQQQREGYSEEFNTSCEDSEQLRNTKEQGASHSYLHVGNHTQMQPMAMQVPVQYLPPENNISHDVHHSMPSNSFPSVMSQYEALMTLPISSSMSYNSNKSPLLNATNRTHHDEIIFDRRAKPQCFDHGCNGREFLTYNDLLEHQFEKSGTVTTTHSQRDYHQFIQTAACKVYNDTSDSVRSPAHSGAILSSYLISDMTPEPIEHNMGPPITEMKEDYPYFDASQDMSFGASDGGDVLDEFDFESFLEDKKDNDSHEAKSNCGTIASDDLVVLSPSVTVLNLPQRSPSIFAGDRGSGSESLDYREGRYSPARFTMSDFVAHESLQRRLDLFSFPESEGSSNPFSVREGRTTGEEREVRLTQSNAVNQIPSSQVPIPTLEDDDLALDYDPQVVGTRLEYPNDEGVVSHGKRKRGEEKQDIELVFPISQQVQNKQNTSEVWRESQAGAHLSSEICKINDVRRETVIVEETRRPTEREDDIVEVIEEHSPPRRVRSQRVSCYRAMDPDAYGGGERIEESLDPVQAAEESLTVTERERSDLISSQPLRKRIRRDYSEESFEAPWCNRSSSIDDTQTISTETLPEYGNSNTNVKEVNTIQSGVPIPDVQLEALDKPASWVKGHSLGMKIDAQELNATEVEELNATEEETSRAKGEIFKLLRQWTTYDPSVLTAEYMHIT